MSSFNTKKPYRQVIKGRIAEVNPCLLHFKIHETDNKTFRIYIDITKPLPVFPCIDDEVEILNPKKCNNNTKTAIIGPETICNFHNVLAVDNIDKLQLFKYLKENNVDEDELFTIDHYLHQLELFVPKYSLYKCLMSVLYDIPLITKGFQDLTHEYKGSFKNVKFRIPSDLTYVNSNSELYPFLKFDGMCWYNVYPNRSLLKVADSYCEYLFGILDVDSVTGYFSLSDKTSKILVRFYTTNKDLYMFKASFVMFKKWTVFTEIFQDKTASSLKYILAHVEDVLLLESMIDSNEYRLFYRINEQLDVGHRKTILLQTIKISEIIYGNDGSECWIEALISGKDNTSSKRLAYVVLTGDHITIVPFLKEHVVYEIIYIEEPKTLKSDCYKELNRLKTPKDMIYKIGKDTIFQETDTLCLPQNDLVLLEDFQDVEKFIKTSGPSKTFSFCLKIAKKELRDVSDFPSWISKRHDNLPYFGTQGKNLQMRLTFMNSGTFPHITLYMPDRDNVVTPLGLIDDMIVKVKNVQVYKNKNLKTNVFSSFEIIEYCPELVFSSVNMSFSDRSAWHWKERTPAVALGMFSQLPQRCIVHGACIFQAISDLKITPVCDKCKRASVPDLQCRSCDIADRDLTIEMSISAYDFVNSIFYMKTENKNLFFELIGLRNRHEIKTFCGAFYKVPVVNVNFCKLEEFQISIRDPESKALVDELIELIRSHLSFNLYNLMEVVCMKRPGASQWKIIDFVSMFN